MISVKDRINKYADAFKRGLMTDSEFACAFVHEIVTLDDSTQISSLFPELPDALKQAIQLRYRELGENGFLWRPLRFGSIVSDEEVLQTQRRLKATNEILKNLIKNP